MKLKGKKISVIAFALFFIFLMLFSIVASSFLQSSRTNKETTVTLPSNNIVENELTTEQENYALQQGKTILKFYYTQTCIECLSQKPFLESIANQFSDQIILEEVIKQNEKVPTLLVFSYYKQNNLFNATRDEIIDSVCDVLIKPPTGCVVRKV
jgi:hypothetical protein